jgi:outer membrane protein OmpA-like peptidoglycan-associated protein
VKKPFFLAVLAALGLVLLLASCATTKGGKTSAATAKSDKTSAAATKSDKTTEATKKSDKTAAATTKSDKTAAAATKSDKTAAATTKSDKTAAAATKADKPAEVAKKTDKTTEAATKTDKTAAAAKTDTTTPATKMSDKEIAADLAKRIKASGLKNVDVKTTARGVTITAGALNFPADAATINAETAKRLDAIAKLLKGYESKKLLIQGHTADVGDKKSQQELSVKRARAVGDYFVRKGVVKAALLVIEGKGGTVPLASNATDEGRAKNRRVEITLLH